MGPSVTGGVGQVPPIHSLKNRVRVGGLCRFPPTLAKGLVSGHMAVMIRVKIVIARQRSTIKGTMSHRAGAAEPTRPKRLPKHAARIFPAATARWTIHYGYRFVQHGCPLWWRGTCFKDNDAQ